LDAEINFMAPQADGVVLVIESAPDDARRIHEALAGAAGGPVLFESVDRLSDGIARLREGNITAILADLFLHDSQGIETFDKLVQAAPDIPILILGRSEDEDIAQQAVQHGALEFLRKDRIDGYWFPRTLRAVIKRKAAEEALFLEKERAQVTLNSIGDAVLCTDVAGNISYLNLVAERMTGWSYSEALGQPVTKVFRLIDGVTREPQPSPLDVAVVHNKTVGLSANSVLVRRNGSESAIEDSASPIHDRTGQITGAVIVFHDVSESRAMMQQMSHWAQHDALTDLPNRLLLHDRLTQAIALASRKGTKLAVLFLDLDGFKHINDSLGHPTGDQLLRLVAARLQAVVRASDTVSRQGGDEFVVLLPEIKHVDDAALSAEKILSSLIRLHTVGTHELLVTASIGISIFPADGLDAETLMKGADTAMYQAKATGRNAYKLFKQTMNVRAVERQYLEGRLRGALEQRELVLYYQREVDLEAGVVTGAEALIRWLHPQRGMLLPAQFVPIAEDCSLIVPIGRWVLREACRQARAWIDGGLPPVAVAVNISAVEFRSKDFLEDVRAILEETCLEPHLLELEMTESVLMQNTEATTATLHALKAIGVRLAVDDFGTGYSSLSYLRQFPVDTLKLDQSFVHDLTTSADHGTIVGAVIDLGKRLRQRVIAEGVETREQHALLLEHQCGEGQGYYFGRPVTGEEFARELREAPQTRREPALRA
jgi:diguanylate cyclase (GGDEF)-like protein/PAS domain S-box-containing protein